MKMMIMNVETWREGAVAPPAPCALLHSIVHAWCPNVGAGRKKVGVGMYVAGEATGRATQREAENEQNISC